ncbi:serine/threonine-protein kinase [Kineococcus sp. SYSU DK003]|uniref:serine/threonine-protein kinase n=1 Tax=Kineococcus sp. SYSU DK003 TaxID=3383124 RepID=UPI003D7E53A0
MGTGSSAVVWLARRVVDDRVFALKVWRRPLSDDRERDLFLREVRQQVALQHDSGHLVTYAWAEVDARPPWIAVEPHGISLQQSLAEHRHPPLSEGMVWAVDLLAGLQALHERKLLHRDVKPANVLVHQGRAKLCDFGLVMDAAGFTQDTAAGTPQYIAPELLGSAATPDYRTDVYSAGATIQEVLGPDLPAGIKQVLTAATSLRATDRPEDAGQFADRLRQAGSTAGLSLPPPLPGTPTPAPSPAPALAPKRPRRARRVALAAAVAVAVGGAGAAFAASIGDGRADDPAVRTSSLASTSSSPPPSPQTADASLAPPDIDEQGRPVVLPAATAGRCAQASVGAEPVDSQSFSVDGTVVAVLRATYSADRHEACAKLIKPEESPLSGQRTHLALTLCGDANSCDHDWNAYSTDAGPTVVPSARGCMSWRVSVLAADGTTWLVRDEVGSTGC